MKTPPNLCDVINRWLRSTKLFIIILPKLDSSFMTLDIELDSRVHMCLLSRRRGEAEKGNKNKFNIKVILKTISPPHTQQCKTFWKINKAIFTCADMKMGKCDNWSYWESNSLFFFFDKCTTSWVTSDFCFMKTFVYCCIQKFS